MILSVIFSVILCGGVQIYPTTAEMENGQMSNFGQSSNKFSANLYAVASPKGENTLLSPLSVNIFLAALYFGSAGSTKEEIKKVLDLTNDDQNTLLKYKNFVDGIKPERNLSIATKMFIDDNFPVKQEYKILLLNDFNADIDNLNIATYPEESRKIINKYVAIKTNNLIQDLFEPGTILSSTKSVLVNAVYFKSNWQYPFDKTLTAKETFYGYDKSYEVDMMSLSTTELKYKEVPILGSKVLSLPYVSDFVFTIILPTDKKGINKVDEKIQQISQKNLQSSFLTNLFKADSNDKNLCLIKLPKFKYEHNFKMRPILEKMGLDKTFTSEANFSKISDVPFNINDIIHRTYINVDEVSTEAAAATADGFGSGPDLCPQNQQFIANSPFLFFITHEPTHTIVFIGRFVHP